MLSRKRKRGRRACADNGTPKRESRKSETDNGRINGQTVRTVRKRRVATVEQVRGRSLRKYSSLCRAAVANRKRRSASVTGQLAVTKPKDSEARVKRMSCSQSVKEKNQRDTEKQRDVDKTNRKEEEANEKKHPNICKDRNTYETSQEEKEDNFVIENPCFERRKKQSLLRGSSASRDNIHTGSNDAMSHVRMFQKNRGEKQQAEKGALAGGRGGEGNERQLSSRGGERTSWSSSFADTIDALKAPLTKIAFLSEKTMMAANKNFVETELTDIEAAQFFSVLAFCLSSLYYVYLRVEGDWNDSHPLKAELERVQTCMKKISDAIAASAPRRCVIDAAAAKRLITFHASQGLPKGPDSATAFAHANGDGESPDLSNSLVKKMTSNNRFDSLLTPFSTSPKKSIHTSELLCSEKGQ